MTYNSQQHPYHMIQAHGTISKLLPGWEEAWDLPNESQAQHTFMRDALPDGPRENTIAYTNLFDFCDYKQDCSTVWDALGSRSVRIKWRNKV